MLHRIRSWLRWCSNDKADPKEIVLEDLHEHPADRMASNAANKMKAKLMHQHYDLYKMYDFFNG